jgi:hypothetical protein
VLGPPCELPSCFFRSSHHSRPSDKGLLRTGPSFAFAGFRVAAFEVHRRQEPLQPARRPPYCPSE